MYLWELFDLDHKDKPDNGPKLVDRLRQSIVDILTPLAANGVPFVTMQSVMDQLRQMRSGIDIDKGLIMQVLDPSDVQLIDKIEGDRIYFSIPDQGDNDPQAEEKEKDADQVAQTASQQAKKQVADQ